MTTTGRRRAHGDDSVYYDEINKVWTAAVSLGHSPDGKRLRRKVHGRTKTQARDKLRVLRQEIEAGLHTSQTYTMAACIDDWLSQALSGLSPNTLGNYQHAAEHARAKLGRVRLRDLTARHVQKALDELAASLSTRYLRLIHQVIERSIGHAQAADLVGRNVASLVKAPKGQAGRPSQSLTLADAVAVLKAAEGRPLHAYVVLSILVGARTEEMRSLPWSDVDLEAGTMAVYRSVRAGGDTKTMKSRRVLKLPNRAVEALREHRTKQAAARLKAGELWQDQGLVFASAVGTPLDAHNVRRSFRAITKAGGIGSNWTPRELRHTFVSLLSANDVSLEDIARLVGHSGTSVTERVYRHEIRPALTQGAEIMDHIFDQE